MEQTQQIPGQMGQETAPNYNPPNKLSKKQQSDWVDKIVKDYGSSATYVETYFKSMWSDMRKMYNSERTLVGYNGISDTFVPMSYSTVEALVASTAGDKPLVAYEPTKPEQNTNVEVLNRLFSYYWDLDGWTLKTIQHSRGLFKLGSSVMYGYWNIDHPCIDNVPIEDWFCDPTTTFFNYQKANFMGHRFLARKSVLEKEQVIDPDTGQLVSKYMNLKKLSDRNDEDETSKEAEDTHRGSVLDKEAQEDEIECIVYYTLDDYIIVGNRQEVIYSDTNPFKARQQYLGYENPTGYYPYMFDAYTPDENQLYGRSVLQPIQKPQELLNDLTNQNIDAVTWSLDPEMELDPMYSDYLEKIESAAGNVYPFKPGSYSPVQKLPIPSSVFNERSNIKNEIREATAIDELIKGSITSQRTTATEAKIQTAQAGKRFDLAVAALENGGYYQMAKLVFQLIQHYVTQPVMFRVVGKGGVDWQTFDPNLFKGDYEPRVKLKVTLDNEKDMKTRDIKEMYTALLGSPFIDQQELEKLALTKGFNLEPDEANMLLKKPEDLQAEADKAGAGKPAGKPPAELINYKDAPPDIQAQMEASAGLQPSATHEMNMQSHLLSQMGQQHSALDAMHTATTADNVLPIPPQGAPQPPQGGEQINPAEMATTGAGVSG